MKNSIIISFFAVALMTVSCDLNRPSTASFSTNGNFEFAAESPFVSYFKDSLLATPSFYMDEVTFIRSSAKNTNEDYRGGFMVSMKRGSSEDSDEVAGFTSYGPSAGVSNSRVYSVFRYSPDSSDMPEYDFSYYLDRYTIASVRFIGFFINNTAAVQRLYENDGIAEGDYLKVTAEFFNKGKSVEKAEKYLVDYRGPENVIVKDWEAWDLSEKTIICTDIKFKVETSSEKFAPCFCADNFVSSFDVQY